MMNEVVHGENFIPADLLSKVWQEIDMISGAMQPPEKCGAAPDKKSGLGYFADKFIAETLLPCSASLKDRVDHDGNYSLLINYYSEGDYYKPHTDDTEKTLTVFLSKEEDSFEGGDFKFPQLDLTLPFKNNSYVVFKGDLEHEVTPVHLKKNTGRYSLTYFFY